MRAREPLDHLTAASNAEHSPWTPASCVFITMLLASGMACSKAPSRDVAATVNGYSITYEELDKYFKSQPDELPEKADEAQVALKKLELLRELIDNQIMLQRAERLGLMAVDSEVDAKIAELKASAASGEFEKQLQAGGMTLEDKRDEVRRGLSIQKLFNKEITSKITITDAQMKAFYEANKANFNLAEPQVHLAQIVVTSVPDPQVRNLRNDKASNEEEARRKIQMLEARLKKGEDFFSLAQSYSEDPNYVSNGGDLGFVPQSALEKADLELRRAVALLQSGEISPALHTQTTYRIVKVISREPAGQRLFSDPRVQQTIRETLLNQKDQLLKAAYYETARNEARVENFLARRTVSESGQSSK